MQETEQNSKEKKSEEIMEHFVSEEFKLFIDTCSVMHDSASKFFTNIKPYLEKYKAKIIFPQKCCEELIKHSKDASNPKRVKEASDAIKLIRGLMNEGYIEIRGESTDGFADNVFLTVFTMHRLNYNLLLITQDKDLAKDIFDLNNDKSVKMKKISVRRINSYGFLSKHDFEKQIVSDKNDEKSPSIDSFKLCTKITSVPDTPINVQIPSEGDRVYMSRSERNANSQAVKLTKALGYGGEGIVYKTDTEYVAKIYKSEKLTERKLKKIRLMLSKDIQCEGVCYPKFALYNKQNEFVGYLMPKAEGRELAKGIFQPMLYEKYYPQWEKRDTVQLCITILNKIIYLHKRNIILGDINPNNILVVSSTEVYFVDTDSYQIEDFPCPVGTVNFTAPEIQGANFGTILRTMGNEAFAVATLLFMIMLPGKSPYAQQGGGSPGENIIKMDFSYPAKGMSNHKTPDGKWRFMWSFLTRRIKEMFFETFKGGEEHSKEEKRYSAEEWLNAFEEYFKLLDKGTHYDSMSKMIFPKRLKKNPDNPNEIYIECSICHCEMPEKTSKNGICRDCLQKVKTQQNKVKIQQNCIDCGKSFSITYGEAEYYNERNLEIPKRCKECRDARKNSPDYYKNPNYNYNNAGKTSYPRTKNYGSPCFITTAVCEYFGKADDCAELTALRAFRDNWLRYQPNGKELIDEYYNTAPLIVSRLKVSPQYAQCCEELWHEYIKPCLDMIDNVQFEECKMRYIEMVRYMQDKFGDTAVNF